MIEGLKLKNWGVMAPVVECFIGGHDEGPEFWSAYIATFLDGSGKTSIHRHSCPSSIMCVSGEASIDISESRRVYLKAGERIFIPSGFWHRVNASPGTILVEDYDTEEDDYPIERYEGEGWPE